MNTQELIGDLESRIETLDKEGREVAQRAASAAYEPYRVAIEENRRVLSLLREPEKKSE